MLVKRTPPKNDPRAMPAMTPPLKPLSLVGLGVSVPAVAPLVAIEDATSDAVLGGNGPSVVPAVLGSVVDDIDSADVSAVAAAQEC